MDGGAENWTRTDSQVLQVLANTLATQNKEHKAADILEYVLIKDPENDEALLALCGVYSLMERDAEVLNTIAKLERRQAPIPPRAGHVSFSPSAGPCR